MKITFEIDTNDEDAQEYLKLINDKTKAYVGINNFCELYRRIYNRKIYDDDIIKYEKIFDPMGDPLNQKTKEWISMEYIESEMEKIFDDLKDFQYWE